MSMVSLDRMFEGQMEVRSKNHSMKGNGLEALQAQ
jgi:hypothetical protein